jgi:hypothetical protein
MSRRDRLTRFLVVKIKAGMVPHSLPQQLPVEEQALYLQGAFFNTAVVQMSEAMVHLCMAIAQHEDVQARLAANLEDDRYLDHVIAETLRLYPLFGISHRITLADIALNEHTTLPQGSVVCFNHLNYHRTGFEDPERFNPDRWDNLSPHEQHYIPFGVSGNRPCPASGLAPVTMRAAVRETFRHYEFYSSASHTRSSPNRGPCLLVSRIDGVNTRLRQAILVFLQMRDRWEDVWRSLVQLVLGTYMVWDARRLRLCANYFEGPFARADKNKEASPVSSCPYSGHAQQQLPSRRGTHHRCK